MNITRRIVGVLVAAALSFAVVSAASPAEARKDTSWGMATPGQP